MSREHREEKSFREAAFERRMEEAEEKYQRELDKLFHESYKPDGTAFGRA